VPAHAPSLAVLAPGEGSTRALSSGYSFDDAEGADVVPWPWPVLGRWAGTRSGRSPGSADGCRCIPPAPIAAALQLPADGRRARVAQDPITNNSGKPCGWLVRRGN